MTMRIQRGRDVREKTLSVVLPGRRVGDLVQDRDGLTRWLPDRSWEAGGQHPRLGVDFLRRPGPRQQGTGLLPWFENLLPEPGSELRRRICAVHGLRDGQSFALLAALGRDLVVLAPCYDLVATVSWARKLGWDQPGGPQLSLRVGGERRFAHLDDEVLAVHVKSSRQRWAGEELMSGIIRARAAWPDVRDQAPPAMRAALDIHWDQVPILRRMGR
jgi:HipA-like protein